jgi:hypothetical protein
VIALADGIPTGNTFSSIKALKPDEFACRLPRPFLTGPKPPGAFVTISTCRLVGRQDTLNWPKVRCSESGEPEVRNRMSVLLRPKG